MDEVRAAIIAAWGRVKPVLERDAGELARRLARRRGVLSRPARASCLCVRAGDLRINKWETRVEPSRAVQARAPHRVLMDGRMMYLLCRAKWIEPPGEDLVEVAARLGFHKHTFRNAVKWALAKRVMSVRHIALLGGKRGLPVPLIWARQEVDVARVGSPVDRVWGEVVLNLVDELPKDFAQWVERLPVEYWRWGEKSEGEERAWVKIPRMPEPVDDSDLHPWSARFRAPKKRTRSARKREQVARDSMKFWGWRWVCPGCRRRVHRLFLPVGRCVIPEVARSIAVAEWDELPKPAMTLACGRCHGVKGYSRMNRGAWNEVVAYLSGGLLYGREVERPEWFEEVERKRRRCEVRRKRATPRRQMVVEMLIKRWSYRRIAREMGVSKNAVSNHAVAAYREHGVRGREGLIRKLAPQEAREVMSGVVRREKMVELVVEGLKNREIGARLKIARGTVEKDLRMIYRAHGVRRRGELVEVVGKDLDARGGGHGRDAHAAEEVRV